MQKDAARHSECFIQNFPNFPRFILLVLDFSAQLYGNLQIMHWAYEKKPQKTTRVFSNFTAEMHNTMLHVSVLTSLKSYPCAA